MVNYCCVVGCSSKSRDSKDPTAPTSLSSIRCRATPTTERTGDPNSSGIERLHKNTNKHRINGVPKLLHNRLRKIHLF